MNADNGEVSPVYRSDLYNEQLWLAKEENPSTLLLPWIMSERYTSSPGSSIGKMFYGPPSAQCPNEITEKAYVDISDDSVQTEQNSITFTCEEGKLFLPSIIKIITVKFCFFKFAHQEDQVVLVILQAQLTTLMEQTLLELL